MNRKDFSLLQQMIDQRPLIYFDNAATTQKPQAVIDSMVQFYSKANGTVHRSTHTLAEAVTQDYEKARNTVAEFIGADPEELIFTSGTTESINAIAQTWALDTINPGQQIILSQAEHHANLVPWQYVAQKKGAVLRFIPILESGQLDMDVLKIMLKEKTALVSIAHISNVLGIKNDIETIIQWAHAHQARVFIDAAQSVGYYPVNVKKLNCDFLAFSAHKMCGPTGIGALYIKKSLHDEVRPFKFGGGMVSTVSFTNADWARSPHKFEAGTPAIAQAIGFAKAVEYVQQNAQLPSPFLPSLCKRLLTGFAALPKIKVLGSPQLLAESGHLVSFTIADMHAHDVAHYLAGLGICVRAGTHCAQPLAQVLGVAASVRVSFYHYNTSAEVDQFLEIVRLIAI